MANDAKASDARAESGKAGGPTMRIDTSSIASTYAAKRLAILLTSVV